MRTTVEIVEILENYLKEKKLSLRKFSALIGISHTTIITWKKKTTLPSYDTICKIASFMNVSPDWLVNGKLTVGENNTLENVYSRRSILYRIELLLRQNNQDYDCDIESLHNKYLKDIVDYEVLINWVTGKANMPEDVLQRIADQLKVSLQWLLTKNEYHQTDFNESLYNLALSYKSFLIGYDTLDQQDQMFIDRYIQTRREIRRLSK